MVSQIFAIVDRVQSCLLIWSIQLLKRLELG